MTLRIRNDIHLHALIITAAAAGRTSGVDLLAQSTTFAAGNSRV
jgi:hypothetical protein